MFVSFLLIAGALFLLSCDGFKPLGVTSLDLGEDGNNSISSAESLSLGDTATLALYPQYDVDYFIFTMPSFGMLRISFSLNTP